MNELHPHTHTATHLSGGILAITHSHQNDAPEHLHPVQADITDMLHGTALTALPQNLNREQRPFWSKWTNPQP